MSTEFRNIFGWLGMKQEEVMLRDAEHHVDVTYETVMNFKKAIEAYIKGDLPARDKFIEKVHQMEKEADVIRTTMVDILSESPLLPPDREDLLHFIKSLDRIADWTNSTSKLLGFLDEKLPQKIMENLSIATELIFEGISTLRNAIRALIKNDLKHAIKYSYEVNVLESKADDHKQNLIGVIIHAKLDAATLLLVYQLAEYLEGVTDKIEDAADFVRIIAIKSK